MEKEFEEGRKEKGWEEVRCSNSSVTSVKTSFGLGLCTQDH